MNSKSTSIVAPDQTMAVQHKGYQPYALGSHDRNDPHYNASSSTARSQRLLQGATQSPPELKYDPEAIEAQYRHKPLIVWQRAIAILLPLITFILQFRWDVRTGNLERNAPKRAVRLRRILTRLGPAFIKVGQAISTRPDLLPPTYLQELAKLQDQLPAFPNEIAYRFIQEELGAPPKELYLELSQNPVAAASLGQVYKGKLKTGEVVAIKVQRPGLAGQIALDIYILRSLAAWIKKTIKSIRSDLVAILDEFASRIFDEMNYIQEGHNAEQFAKLYGHLTDIYVPKIYWQYTNRRVLTMEWITGTKLTRLDEIQRQGIDATYLVNIGVQCSLRQLLEHGFFHADPHPGNLLATPDGKLAYLDFGMMSTIKPYQRYGLIEAVVHLVNRDFEKLVDNYIELEFLTPDTDVTPIVPALAEVFNNALGASVAELNFKSITDKFSSLMYEYPFRVPPYYALIVRSLVTLEGIAINVDPNFKVLSKSYPYIAKRLLIDPSPRLRTALRDLLFKDGDFRWNRLENLLRNARGSDDYDIEKVIDQTVDFLFSERGDFIRASLVNEIASGIDLWGQNAMHYVTSGLQVRTGVKLAETRSIENQETAERLERLQRIGEILQTTQGFDPLKLAPVVAQLLAKPELQQMGQQIASNLAQRVLARFIREFLLSEPDMPVLQNAYREVLE